MKKAISFQKKIKNMKKKKKHEKITDIMLSGKTWTELGPISVSKFLLIVMGFFPRMLKINI